MRVGAEGRRHRGALISVTVLSAPGLKLGITVSKKVHKSAVIRNRIKRQLREIFRLHRPRFQKQIEIVISARTEAVGVGYKELESEFLKLLEKYLEFSDATS